MHLPLETAKACLSAFEFHTDQPLAQAAERRTLAPEGDVRRFRSSVSGNPSGYRPVPMEFSDMTVAAEQRRLAREKRRGVDAGARPVSGERARRRGSPSEVASLADAVRERVGLPSPRAAAWIGAAVGAVAGLITATSRKKRVDGNVISGDVAVHLLNRVELLTIRLQVRHARRGMPVEIDVHRVDADASSRPS
jgi:hypothetical protein